MPDDVTFRVTGIRELNAAIDALTGKEQARAVAASMSKTMRRVAVPVLRAEARAQMKRPGSHRDRKGVTVKPGRKGPIETRITVRKARLRRGETVALSAGSRAWYDHLFTRRTRAHVIEARTGPGGTAATSRQVRAINRLERGEYRGAGAQVRALFFRGVFREQVRHPGTPGHDWVAVAGRRIGPALQRALVDDLRTHVIAAKRKARATTRPRKR